MRIIVFTSKDCASCHPLLEAVRKVVNKKFPAIKVEEHPVETYPQEASKFWIRSTPTSIFFDKEKPLNTMVGAYPFREIEEWIKESLELRKKK